MTPRKSTYRRYDGGWQTTITLPLDNVSHVPLNTALEYLTTARAILRADGCTDASMRFGYAVEGDYDNDYTIEFSVRGHRPATPEEITRAEDEHRAENEQELERLRARIKMLGEEI
jgi:hypothetical protein